jgi:5'-deoxynucleotidase YfbR-like HD superfamily hydrolase
MSWIVTNTGKRVDLNNVQLNQICIEDIAVSLSKQCRFNGHCNGFYSVAQHSVLVSEIVSTEFKFEALMHDATEAYIGDMVSPLKGLIPDFQRYEDYLWQVIATKFGLNPRLSADTKQADMIMLATEKRDLMPHHPDPWPALEGITPINHCITAWGSKISYDRFMEAFNQLNKG